MILNDVAINLADITGDVALTSNYGIETPTEADPTLLVNNAVISDTSIGGDLLIDAINYGSNQAALTGVTVVNVDMQADEGNNTATIVGGTVSGDVTQNNTSGDNTLSMTDTDMTGGDITVTTPDGIVDVDIDLTGADVGAVAITGEGTVDLSLTDGTVASINTVKVSIRLSLIIITWPVE